jgi:SAM-dependent methyltransferase
MEPAEYAAMAAAEDTHWWYVGLHDLAFRLACEERRRAGRPLDILDAGCGTGRLCQILQSLGNVAGCDFHPLAVDATARRGIRPVQQCNLVTDDLGDAVFDFVTCHDVLVHRAVTDEVAMLRNLHRALRPGGRLLLQVAAFNCLRGAHDDAVHGERRYRRPRLSALLREAGFQVEFITYRLLPFFPPILAWRRLTRRRAPRDSAGRIRSDVAHCFPAIVNGLLAAVVRIENRLLVAGLPLPLGTSAFAVARKPLPPA